MGKKLERATGRDQDSFEGLTEKNAGRFVKIMGGESWQSGGGIMLILFRRRDGKLVVLSDEAVCEYSSEAKFEKNQADTAIHLR